MMTSSNDRLSQLRNLLDKDPHDAFCMYAIAMEHANEGHTEEAIAWFTRTIETDPAYCYAWYHKAQCQETAGNSADAAQTLHEGIEHANEYGDSHAAEEMSELLESIS